MTAFILFILATAGVKGFAFTLGIGTLVSLFTAVLATQAILGTMGRSRMISRVGFLAAGEKRERRHFDYMGASRWFRRSSSSSLRIVMRMPSRTGRTASPWFSSWSASPCGSSTGT